MVSVIGRSRRYPCHPHHTTRWGDDLPDVPTARVCPSCGARWLVSRRHASPEVERAVGHDVFVLEWERRA